MDEVKGKRCLVTGGAGGIGRATAQALATEGASLVVVSDIDADAAATAAAAIAADTGCRTIPAVADLSRDANVKELFARLRREADGLDVLVNCAGICPTEKLEEVSSQQWDRTMGINLRSVFLCCQAAVAMMREGEGGSIVNVSSISGRIGGIATGVDYVTSKGGILALTMALAKAGGPDGIRVNNVAPGFIDTQMTKGFTHFDAQSVPLQRIGLPADVADVILFLASERSRYITGCTLDVNGGIYMN